MGDRFGKPCRTCGGSGEVMEREPYPPHRMILDVCPFCTSGLDGDASHWPAAVADHETQTREILESQDSDYN